MKRKAFLKNLGIGTIAASGGLISCSSDDGPQPSVNGCNESPKETAGPFPIKSPADMIRENIAGDRTGIPLIININVENTSKDCEPLAGVLVDIWHCDAKGNYSEYSSQLDGDFTGKHFLRGRQTTNAQGVASFVSIYPGWYPGRAPHLHLEILSSDGRSLLVTQTAFPEEVSKAVYATTHYKGDFDTSNARDGEFRDSLSNNLAESVEGDVTRGYTLNATIKVVG